MGGGGVVRSRVKSEIKRWGSRKVRYKVVRNRQVVGWGEGGRRLGREREERKNG
jgi:hypothetical protein